MQQHISIREALRFGWQTTKQNSRLVFTVMITFFALQIVSSIIGKTLQGTPQAAAASIIISVVGIWIGAGFIQIVLRLARGEHTRYSDLFPSAKLAWRYFLTTVVSGLFTAIPLMLGIICSATMLRFSGVDFKPLSAALQSGVGVKIALAAFFVGVKPWLIPIGIVVAIAVAVALYFGVRFSMVRFAFFDAAQTGYIKESLRKSSELTSGIKWRLFGCFVVFGLINLLGAILFLVGLLVTVPMTMLAFAHIYLALKAH